MTEEMFARLVGRLMAGCQAPMSMGMLGAAREPLIELRDHLGLGFGWHTNDESEKAVAQWLEANRADDEPAPVASCDGRDCGGRPHE